MRSDNTTTRCTRSARSPRPRGATPQRLRIVQCREGWHLEHEPTGPRRADRAAEAHAARELLAADRLPTAVLAGNDQCAHGLLDTLIRAGLSTPDDISVVGFDDSPVARLSFIELTTVRQDAVQIAELAVQAAAERLDGGRTTPRDIVVDPTLVIRSTTGPPRTPR